MRGKRKLGWVLLMAAPWCSGASLDFAISMSLLSPYNRFGVDLQGNILIAAHPSACTLPTVNPLSRCGPIWIGKLDASGQTLLFATYLGTSATSGITDVAGIAADSNGNVIVAGHSTVPDLPTAKAFQPAPKSQFASLYLAKLSADGARLIYATYLGGSGGQSALSLAVDRAGAAYVAGTTTSSDFPSTPQPTHALSGFSTIVAKLGPEGTLQYAATFPFEFYTDVRPIQVDAMGRAVLVSKAQVLTVSPDGGSLERTAVPEWVAANELGEAKAGRSAGGPFAIPRSGGGFQYVGTGASGVPVTADALQTFDDSNGYVRIENGQASLPQLMGPVSGFAVDPKDRKRIYAATPSGLFLSEDNGWTWSMLRDGSAMAIAIDPFDSNRLYLSLDARPPLYRSKDGGASWTPINIPIDMGVPEFWRISSLAADPNIPGLLYAAGGLTFRSKDGGDTWDARSVGPSQPNMSPSASTSTKSGLVQVDPAHPGWAYVTGITSCTGFCGDFPVLSRTQDGGNSWTDVLTGTFALAAAVDPNTGDVITEEYDGPLRSKLLVLYPQGDFGARQVLSGAPQTLHAPEASTIAFDPEHPGTIYLGVHIPQGAGSGYFVMESVDDGDTFTPVVQLDRPVSGLTVSAGGVLHASQTPNPQEGYVVVTDGAGTVQYGTYLGGAFTQINSVAASGGKVFVAGKTQGGLPLLNAAQTGLGGGTDGFVAVFDDSGVLLWSTYLGGSADDSIDWILPLADGSVVVVGTTNSADFPLTQASPLGTGNSFIAHLRP